MSMTIGGRKIDRVRIIDDDPESRGILELTIEETNLTAVPQNEPIFSLSAFLAEFVSPTDAIVSDHHLRKKNYFPVNGAEVVSNCYEKGIPSVLVTKYEQVDIKEIRRFRHRIPIILSPDEFDPDALKKSLEICISEFQGKIQPERKAWRTLIQVDDVDINHIYVIVPSWNPNETISINKSDLPDYLKSTRPDARFHAKVNIGAQNANDLFFLEWESK